MQAATLLHITVGMALVLAAWLAPRRIARAGLAPVAVMLLDIMPFTLAAALLAVATGRPLFAGVVVAALGAGFCLADHTMRETLARAGGLLRIGRAAAAIYAPASLSAVRRAGAGHCRCSGRVGGSAGLAGFRTACMGAASACRVGSAGAHGYRRSGSARAERPVGIAAGALRRIVKPSGEPFADTATLGPFATLFAHTVIARAERVARRRRFAAPDETHQLRSCGTLHAAGTRPPMPVTAIRSRFPAGRRTTGRDGSENPLPSRSLSCSANCFSTRGGSRRRSRRSCWPGSPHAARRPPNSAGSSCPAGARTRCAPSLPC